MAHALCSKANEHRTFGMTHSGSASEEISRTESHFGLLCKPSVVGWDHTKMQFFLRIIAKFISIVRRYVRGFESQNLFQHKEEWLYLASITVH
jgi:hypothetical protein